MSVTAPLLEICVPSGIFCLRNIKKVETGEKARSTVAFAQAAKIAQAVAQYDDKFSKTSKSAAGIFNNLAKESKIIDYTGKAVKWATRNVNPLICASGVVKVAASDDKIGTAISETGALAGMFAGEGLMKLHLSKVFNEKNVSNIATKAAKSKYLESIAKFILKNGNSSKLAAILKGIVFVCGSVTSYSLGSKLVNHYADRVKAGFGIQPEPAEKIDQKA